VMGSCCERMLPGFCGYNTLGFVDSTPKYETGYICYRSDLCSWMRGSVRDAM